MSTEQAISRGAKWFRLEGFMMVSPFRTLMPPLRERRAFVCSFIQRVSFFYGLNEEGLQPSLKVYSNRWPADVAQSVWVGFPAASKNSTATVPVNEPGPSPNSCVAAIHCVPAKLSLGSKRKDTSFDS